MTNEQIIFSASLVSILSYLLMGLQTANAGMTLAERLKKYREAKKNSSTESKGSYIPSKNALPPSPPPSVDGRRKCKPFRRC